MKHTFAIVMIVVAVFIGYMLGYSIPPFIHAGVFSTERTEKGVEVKIDDTTEQYYKELYKDSEEAEE